MSSQGVVDFSATICNNGDMASIGKTQAGTWRVYFRDEAGKSQTKTFRLKSDAEMFRVEIAHDRLTGNSPNMSLGRLTVHDFAQEWFRALTVRPKTRDGYREKYNIWVLPYFGAIPVAKVYRSNIQSWAMSITEEHGKSESTRDQAVNALRGVLNLAVERRAIKFNPAMNLGLPSFPPSKEMTFLKMDQIRRLAEAAEQVSPSRSLERRQMSRLVIETAAFTGMRAGELWALQYVDIIDGQIIVRRSVTSLSDSTLSVGLTKSSTMRRVPMPEWLAEKIETWGRDKESTSLVFPNSDGTYVRHSNFLNQVFYPARELAQLGATRFHDLRHTYASMLIGAGADPKIVQRRMGHSTISITFDVYGHVMPEKDQGITEALGARYLESGGDDEEKRAAVVALARVRRSRLG